MGIIAPDSNSGNIYSQQHLKNDNVSTTWHLTQWTTDCLHIVHLSTQPKGHHKQDISHQSKRLTHPSKRMLTSTRSLLYLTHIASHFPCAAENVHLDVRCLPSREASSQEK